MTGVMPAAVADERWRTMLPDVASRQMPDLPRTFGTAHLPPLVSPDRLLDTQRDHLKRTLPPPRLPSPRDQARTLPSLSRAGSTIGQGSVTTPMRGSGGADGARLDRSESEAVNTLAELSTGARDESAADPDPDSKSAHR